MILMALDHAHYFVSKVHPGEFWGHPLPQYDDLPAFITRFVTHLCAPGFFFLLGWGMALFSDSRRQMGWTESRITHFFVARGMLLILLQFLLENPAWLLGMLAGGRSLPSPPGGGGAVWLHFGVLWALGGSMMIWGVVRRLPRRLTVVLSLGALVLTWVSVPSNEYAPILFSPLTRLLLLPGQTGIWQVFYPLVPWFGVAGLGLVFGTVLAYRQATLTRLLICCGAACLSIFVLLRGIGQGDFHSAQSGLIGFFNVTKYPPSLVFLLWTLGLNLTLLGLFTRLSYTRPFSFLATFGRVPLFFYCLHLHLYAVVGLALPSTSSLATAYLVWLLVLGLLYPACRWYGQFKQRTAPDSLWKFF